MHLRRRHCGVEGIPPRVPAGLGETPGGGIILASYNFHHGSLLFSSFIHTFCETSLSTASSPSPVVEAGRTKVSRTWALPLGSDSLLGESITYTDEFQSHLVEASTDICTEG